MDEDIAIQLEQDLAWRKDEIRVLENSLQALDESDAYDFSRRALILMLYAHFEGFCKHAFQTYVDSINSMNLVCREVDHTLAASSLSHAFDDMLNNENKSGYFKNSLPDDRKLHRFARNTEFLQRIDEFNEVPVNIPDKIIDLESNLKPTIIRKILFCLGFRYDLFSSMEGTINRLLNYRNNIAHGRMKNGIKYSDYCELKDSVYSMLTIISEQILKALEDRNYLRCVSSGTA